MRPGSPSSPSARGGAPAPSAAMAAAMSGAVDLAAVKARSEAQARAATAPPPAAGTAVAAVTEANFQAEVMDRSFQVPVLLLFTVDRDPGVAQFTADLEAQATRGGASWVLAKVDIDTQPGLAQALQVRAVPTAIAVVGGQLVEGLAFQGALPADSLDQFVAALVQVGQQAGLTGAGAPPAGDAETEPAGPPPDPRFDAAEQALEGGDFDLAGSRYQAILDAEPANADARAALLQVGLLRRLTALPPDAVERAAADPTDVPAVLAAADTQLAAGQVDAALAGLLGAFTRVTGEDRDAVRSRLVEYFEILGPDDPRVGPARRRLAAALF